MNRPSGSDTHRGAHFTGVRSFACLAKQLPVHTIRALLPTGPQHRSTTLKVACSEELLTSLL